jgi:hypothetical protein
MTSKTNPLNTLIAALKKKLGDSLAVQVSEPFHESGVWIVDCWQDDYQLVIQYEPGVGFGISSAPDEFATKPDEFFVDGAAAYVRLLDLLQTRGQTIPTFSLAQFRKPLTQEQMASTLGVRQPSYARLETKSIMCMQLGTLSKIFESTGAKLYLIVEDKNGTVFRLGESGTHTERQGYDSPLNIYAVKRDDEQTKAWREFKTKLLTLPPKLSG